MTGSERTVRWRKCTPTLAAATGAVLCLSGASAHAVSGTDGNDIPPGSVLTLFGGKVSFMNNTILPMMIPVGPNSTAIAGTGTAGSRKVGTYIGGAFCTFAANWWTNRSWGVHMDKSGGASRYVKLRFTEGATTKYGWLQYQLSGDTFAFGAWSYNNTGGNIKTLAESVTAKKLSLSSGHAKLHWTNSNEQDVARYAVEVKGKDGAWVEVDGDVPGAGTYNAKVSSQGTCRLAIEHIDGTTEYVGF